MKTNKIGKMLPMFSVTLLFFMWGFITSLNDILIPYLKSVYSLSHFEANIVQFAFFIAYFVGSFIFYLLSKKGKDTISLYGYKTTLVIGLLVSSVACSVFALSAYLEMGFGVFLMALFMLGLGLTFLQIAANPFVALIGNPATASSRLNLSQAFNSLGTTLGPAIGGYLIFTYFMDKNATSASGVILPYLFLSLLLLVLAIFIAFVKINIQVEEKQNEKHNRSIFSYPYVVLGALGIFFYVGAEVAVGSNIVSYLKESMQMPEALAAAYLSYYWGGAMIGRFLGSVSLSNMSSGKKTASMVLLAAAGFAVIYVINYLLHGLSFGQVAVFLAFMILNFLGFQLGKGMPSRLLAIFALLNVVLICTAMLLSGPIAIWSLLAIGLFNSIMWSNVFTLAIDGLENRTAEASSILIMMILGGAVLPPLQGMLADCIGIRLSFFIPMISYIYLLFYGIAGCKIGKNRK
ncbi:MAG: sugar MFS transporter [Bacteroidales bacterium]|nr:sugar MFS transporter [Bacteroidales bacterium]